MFTGIITHIGTIGHIEKTGDWVITIHAPGFAQDAAIGASIACSGVCLTVLERGSEGFTVQASQETLSCTTLGDWKKGTLINLERALKVGDELGGHFVSGHVDGVAVVERMQALNPSMKLEFFCHPRHNGSDDLFRFIAAKGSVTLDGVSLTVNEVNGAYFTVNMIRHTLKATTLGERKVGDRVNLEIDLVARYLARFAEK